VLIASSLTFAPSTQAQVPTPTVACTITPTPTQSPTATPTASTGCSVTPALSPIPSPALVAVPSPQPGDGTTLQWRIFAPQNSGSGPWPAVLLIHGGGFREGDPIGGAIGTVAAQLAESGYYVAVPTYRLAPWGLITGQPCHQDSDLSGRPPEQTNDIKHEVIALRGDSHCNGKIGAVGGSGGGAWATWVALDTNNSGNVYPFWHSSDRVDCAVSISGAYEFDDRTPEDYPSGTDPLPNFAANVENYTNSNNPVTQHGYSPVTLVTSSARPLFLINSLHDSMPYHQIVDMICALESVGLSEANGDFQSLTIQGNDHSFSIWFDWDGVTPVGDGPSKTVGTDAIEFLDAHLK